MYKRKQLYSFRAPQRFTLNITSMADMFTILLVFLLQNYNLAEFKIEPKSSIDLPSSNSLVEPKRAPVLILTKGELLFNDKPVMSFQEWQQKPSHLLSYIDGPGVAQSDGVKEKDFVGDEKAHVDASIIVLADKSHNYSTIKTLLQTLNKKGYRQVRFATLGGG
ncbi:MAG: biopolymer transporter ExbD [Bdellovibrionaceae bacterium]|nr:biopolymer transporter ExbD [Pseudobdellovibrionaceae bacterium]